MGGQQSTDLDLSLIHNRSERSGDGSGSRKHESQQADNTDMDVEPLTSNRFKRQKFKLGEDIAFDFSKRFFDETVSLPDYSFISDTEVSDRLSCHSCPAMIDVSRHSLGEHLNSDPSFELTEGQARRGNFADCEFECSRIREYLYVCGATVAASLTALQMNNIHRVANCSGAVVDNMFEDVPGFEYLKLDMVDGREDDILWFVCEVIHFIEQGRIKGANTLIHCEKGISRSCSFAIAYGMWLTGHKWMEELRYVQQGRKICNPNTAFTCNLIEFGKLLSGEWSTRCLLFRCAHHLPHDLGTAVMKLCVDPTTRTLVPPDLTWFARKGVYLIRPTAARPRRNSLDQSQLAEEEPGESTVYIWLGDHASPSALLEAKRLIEFMRGVLFDKQAKVDVVNMGLETAKFLSIVQRELSSETEPVQRPTYQDYWETCNIDGMAAAAPRHLIAQERAVRGIGTEMNQSYVFRKAQSPSSAAQISAVDEDCGSVVSDLAFSEDEDVMFGSHSKDHTSNITGRGFSLSLPITRGSVLSALETTERSDEDQQSARAIPLRDTAIPSQVPPLQAKQQTEADIAAKPIVAPRIPVSPATDLVRHRSEELLRSGSSKESTPSIAMTNANGTLHGSSRRSDRTGSARLTGMKRFNVPSLAFSGSPMSSGNNSLSGSSQSESESTPSSSRSSAANDFKSVPSHMNATQLAQLGMLSQLSASDRVRSLLGPTTDIRRSLSSGTTGTAALSSHRDRDQLNRSRGMSSCSPRSSTSPKTERVDSTRLPIDVGLARGATPVQDLLPSSARMVKRSKHSSKTPTEACSSMSVGALSDQSMSADSSQTPQQTEATITSASNNGILPPSSAVGAFPDAKPKIKPALFVLEAKDFLYPSSSAEWIPMHVYDDDDLSDDSVYLLLCSKSPHFLWIGASVDWSGLIQKQHNGESIEPLTLEDADNSASQRERRLRSHLAEVSLYVSNVYINWLDTATVRIERKSTESAEFWDRFCDGY